MCNRVACMQRRKPGSWDTLIMPEGSPSRRVHIKHAGITGEGQPVHLDPIIHVLPTDTSWQEEFPDESNATRGIHVSLVAMHIMTLKRIANQVKTKISVHLSNCKE